MSGPIKKNRKRHARSIRKGVGNKLQDGKVETHRMEWGTAENKKGEQVYHVNPSWKKGKDKREAMKAYRQSKKSKSNPYM